MSVYVVFRIELHQGEQSYDMLGVFSDIQLAHAYIKRRLKERLDSGFKKCPILTKEKYFTAVGKRGSFSTNNPGFLVEIMDLDKHYR